MRGSGPSVLVLLAALVFLVTANPTGAEEPCEGYTLISPMVCGTTHLIDMSGSIVHTWHGPANPTSIAYLLDDGSILRPCKDVGGYFNSAPGAGGRLQIIDADDTLVWEYFYSSADHQQHHDVAYMPSGNILVLAWEKKSMAEAIAAGRQDVTGEMWPNHIVEIEPTGPTSGQIVWEWHVWDHLIQDADPTKDNFGVVAEHPELLDINYGIIDYGGDWNHSNSIDYHPVKDQIVFSYREMEEFYVIDHSTTTEEAAGHTGGSSGRGGDILYRWGNPQVYDRGDEEDRRFFVIHGAEWVDPGLPGDGNIIAFDNGDHPGTANDWSIVYEVTPPTDGNGHYVIEPGEPFGPQEPAWMYGGPGTFYGGATQGGAFRLPNGNTLVCGSVGGHLIEVSGTGAVVWEHWWGEMVARAPRYVDETAGIGAHGVELFADPGRLASHPNPFNPFTRIDYRVPQSGHVRLEVYDVAGRCVARLVDRHHEAGEHQMLWHGVNEAGRQLASGIYVVRMETAAVTEMRKITALR